MYSRYIKILAVEIDKELKPFWEVRAEEEDKYGSLQTTFYDPKKSYPDLPAHEVYWDMVDKKVVSGVVIDIKNDTSKLRYKIGQEVLINKDHSSVLHPDKIIDIAFLDYKSYITKVQDLSHYDLNSFTEEQKKLLSVIGIVDRHIWEPTYIMASGFKTIYEHKIFTIAPK